MQDDNIEHTVTVTLTYKVQACNVEHANDIVKEILGDVSDDKLHATDFFAIES